MHVSDVSKNPDTYEQLQLDVLGNHWRGLITDLSGRSNIIYKAKELGIELDPQDKRVNAILNELKKLESEGYEFEGADASFELLIRNALDEYRKPFELKSVSTLTDKRADDAEPINEVTLIVQVDGVVEHKAAEC